MEKKIKKETLQLMLTQAKYKDKPFQKKKKQSFTIEKKKQPFFKKDNKKKKLWQPLVI